MSAAACPAAALTCSLAVSGHCLAAGTWAAGWRAAVRRGSSSVTAAATATRAAFTDMATTMPETNVPVSGALPRTL